MLLKIKENIKYILYVLIILLLIALLCFINTSVKMASETNNNTFSYIVKVRDTVEEIDKIFERAEVNVNVLADAISNSYDTSRQQDKNYNLAYVKSIDGLVKSVLVNSPNVDGDWFQINADLPFSVSAYNWYQFKEDQFINVKDQLAGTPSMNRKITPEDDPYYFDALNGKRAVWSDVYKDADTKTTMMTISAPAYKDASLVGVVGIDISTNNLQDAMKNMQLVLGDSELFLLDKKNNLILSQLLSDSKTNINNLRFLNLFQNDQDGQIEYYDNLTKKTAIMLNLSNKYKIVITFENSNLFGGFDRLFSTVYSMFALLTVLIIFMILIYQFKIININFKLPKSKKPENTDSDVQSDQEDTDSTKEET